MKNIYNSSKSTEQNSSVAVDSSNIGWQNILMGIGLYCIVFITIAGNVLVLVAFVKEKKLRTVFNLYIVNLDITDLGVAATAMSFYIIDNILGYWPFGEVMCGFWILCDYGMTFASVFTLIVISVDRFWSVSWSLHYRTHHKTKKAYICIAIVWIAMVILWLPACVLDRIKNATPGICFWEPSLNTEYVIFIATVGHHGSCFVLLFCYIQVFCFIRKRKKVVPLGSGRYSTSYSVEESQKPYSPNRTKTIMINTENNHDHLQTGTSKETSKETLHIPTIARSKIVLVNTSNKHQSEELSTMRREKKVFITLSYIIVGYIICWVPFHIVFDISSIKPDAVPNIVYTITFWMTYLNSTINPFLYNFSCQDFRDAFKRIICRKMN